MSDLPHLPPILEPATTAVPSAFGRTGATDPASWDDWATSLRPLSLDAERVTVIAPHPDDETFGCGGLIAEFTSRSVEVSVVTVSDGGASHLGHPDLVERRRAEQRSAVKALGCGEAPVWLGLPDGRLVGDEHELGQRLGLLIEGSDLVVGPWPGDRHPDHEVVGRVTFDHARRMGVRALAYPVWLWRWGGPHHLARTQVRRLPLSDGGLQAKLAAMSCFPTQTTSMLGEAIIDREMLDRFSQPFEVYVDA